MLLDLRNKNLTGKEAESYLAQAGIICNKNGVPYDDKPPTVTSGIRLGTPAITTRGLGEKEVVKIASMIHRILDSKGQSAVIDAVKTELTSLLKDFPVYAGL